MMLLLMLLLELLRWFVQSVPHKHEMECINRVATDGIEWVVVASEIEGGPQRPLEHSKTSLPQDHPPWAAPFHPF
uniref:Putative secreted protein n=1 Tax=Anopheles triannulatus TaxID=58253 RepID=A0A2M4B7T4_9DIPT